jgi:hypothetical protein
VNVIASYHRNKKGNNKSSGAIPPGCGEPAPWNVRNRTTLLLPPPRTKKNLKKCKVSILTTLQIFSAYVCPSVTVQTRESRPLSYWFVTFTKSDMYSWCYFRKIQVSGQASVSGVRSVFNCRISFCFSNFFIMKPKAIYFQPSGWVRIGFWIPEVGGSIPNGQ